MTDPKSRQQTGKNNLYDDSQRGIDLLSWQHQAIIQIISDLAHEIPAYFVLLTDVTGQIVTIHGERNNAELAALGALVAGDLAASQEIARLTGEYHNHQMILREGERTNTFIAEAGGQLILLVQVYTQVPLGWARILIRKVATNLAEVVSSHQGEEEPDSALSQADLPDLFKKALDNIWLE